MSTAAELPPWKEALDAIVGARAHGQSGEILPRLQKLDAAFPHVAEINFQMGWTCEVLGRAEEAISYYDQAIALGLAPNEHSGALIGLGSCLRVIGQLERSASVLQSGRSQFPANREFDAFLALTLYAQNQPREAMRLMVEVLCETTEDPGLTAYQRTLRHAVAAL